ncbi:SGNH/GDSL hydrolase family protein [Alkalicoccobacillus murimartini]|uniref:SGNH/GDSL hydrolase family protein n=1 Tax=Alkalicoccobacillus murimartini TaxID=171685 RepID=A0ABT9YG27_9BACI|nr:SGNH/GDSL hydrolase family protein [Alkalicoccobacillus murimartini]MDQ0206815.1 hypothetical protein [Alkalicoccobacillus murimartini]
MTSTEALNSNELETLLESEADIVFLESLTLNDNSAVLPLEESEESITELIDQFSSSLPDAEIILFPSNPLLNPRFYLTQIDELSEYAEDLSVHYADHWEAWPDVTDPEIEEYATSGIPTEQGHEILADYMMQFLNE